MPNFVPLVLNWAVGRTGQEGLASSARLEWSPQGKARDRRFKRWIIALNLAFFTLGALPSQSFAQTQSCESIFADAELSAAGFGEASIILPPREFNLFSFYLNKLREVTQIDRSAIFAMTLRFLIFTTSDRPATEMVKLNQLKPIHPITRDASLEKMNNRMEALLSMPQVLLEKPLTEETLNRFIPSKNSIRAIESDDHDFVVFDGNGRLYAMQKTLPAEIPVEVQVFHSHSSLLQRVLKKLRLMRNVYN